MTTKPMIQIPDTKAGDCLVKVKGVYFVLYFEDGKQKRKTTSTGDRRTALSVRDQIYRQLKKQGATVKVRLTPQEKIASGRDLYVYYRMPYYLVIGGKRIGEYPTRKLAREARDKFLG